MQDKLTEKESLEIYDHLDMDCPDCEAFLARMSIEEEAKVSKMVDDLSDQNTLSMTAHSNIAVLNLPGPMPSVVKSWGSPAMGISHHLTSWFGGIAALLLISVGILPQLYLNHPGLADVGPGDFMKSKGLVSPERAFELEFLTGHRQQDGHLAIERGLKGKDYNENTLMLFRYKTSVSGYVYLIGVPQDANAEVLYPLKDASVQQLPQGEYNISDNDEVIAYPLTGLNGRYIVVGLFSPRPLDMNKDAITRIQGSVDSMTGAVNKKSVKTIGRDVVVDTVFFDIGT